MRRSTSRPVARLLIASMLATCIAPVAVADEDARTMAPPPALRSVLDGHPRMVSIPLGNDLWVAYDATHCALYKSWVGKVKLDGAVFTTVHGPQPTAQGVPLTAAEIGPVWSLRRGGRVQRLEAHFDGYAIRTEDATGARRVTLRYTLPYDGGAIRVQEEPLASSDAGNEISRRFLVDGVPEGAALLMDVYAECLTGAGSLKTNAVLEGLREVELHSGGETLCGARGQLLLEPAGTTVLSAAFDLKAARGRHEAMETLRRQREAAADGQAEEAAPSFEEYPEQTLEGAGVSVRVYHIGESMSRLHALVEGQTPNVSKVLPLLDMRTARGDFGIEDEFIVHVDATLLVDKPGTYAFRLSSDDGSKLYLDEKLLIDNDGLHGVEARTEEIALEPGRHALFVEMFENGGGEQLTLEWRPPGETEFVLVPNAALRAPAGEVRVTSPGKKKIVGEVDRGRPGDGRPLKSVHPSFDLMTVRPEGFEPRVGGIDWLPDGRMVMCAWEGRGGVYVLDGVHGDDRAKITVKRIAEGLAEPLGIQVVDGRIFVLQKQELTELVDTDGDEVADEYRCVAAGWGVTANFHEFAFGLAYREGFFYAALATAIDPGGASTKPQNPDRGKVVKISLADGSYEFVAQGLRTPNGIGWGVDGELFVTDNQGDWLPVSKVVHVSPGAFFGSHSVDPEGTQGLTEKPPVVWLPQGEIGNSPGEPGLMAIGPYAGQMLHSDVTHGGLKRVFVEKIEDQYQGCVFRFTQGLEAGINRWKPGPDDSIFVGGIGSTGNWGQTGKARFGLQRLRYNGKATFELLAVRAVRNGFELEFTEPLDYPAGNRTDDYAVTRWRYEPTEAYGGPKKDVTAVPVERVLVSVDRRKVFLALGGMQAGHVFHVRVVGPVRSLSDQALFSTEGWYTLNALPVIARMLPMGKTPEIPANTLTDGQRAEGWTLLFDGTSTDAWRGYKREDLPTSWSAADGALHFAPGEDRGDVVTKAQYESFELQLEWKVGEKGNSGIMFHVTETRGAPWETGPEMQVLDNRGHGDGLNPLSSAGADYALHAPRFDATRPPGSWNHVRLVVRGPHVEHWLNGYKIVSYELWSDDWKRRVAASKFAKMPDFGLAKRGHICLQDHGDPVWYRNIRIRELTE